ncbi:MAG: RIP metalloprotease RseP [Luteolibacter sp.]
MPAFSSILQVTLLVLIIVMSFNVIIFVHELGHYWAAKWRGLKIDRFQIWFGKPIWSKTVNGVRYGLGWIPAGGFVALPQMAPMEAIEGGESASRKALPPITPLDKIIVAFAGPLFSMLLALLAAVVVWQVGKPKDFVPVTQIGFVEPGSPAQQAGLLAGDRILKINGQPVNGFAGSLDSIFERIILSRGDRISFEVERPGESQPLTIVSGFKTEASKWYQRRGLRSVGFGAASDSVVGKTIQKSPAADAGLQKGEKLVSVDGLPLYSPEQFSLYLKGKGWSTVRVGVRSPDGATREVSLTPEIPLQPTGSEPKIGVLWERTQEVDTRIVKPGPFRQVAESLEMMWTTITSVAARNSNIGVDHLSGPVGIAKMQYQLLQTEDGWRRLLAFFVLFNVNLAVLNMLPFPVLDGGHITLALLEKIFGRPVQSKPLEIIQTACALALISLMLFVTSKDIGDSFGRGSKEKKVEMEFP